MAFFKDNGSKNDITKFIKFAITGVLNTGVDFGVFTLLSFLGLNIYLTQTISYSCGILNSYIINRSWTFKTKKKFFSLQLVKFLVVNIGLLLLSIASLYLFCDVLSLPTLVGKVITTGFTVVLGFVINKLWVF